MSDDEQNSEGIPFNVSENYAIDRIIGEGAYGVVVYVLSPSSHQPPLLHVRSRHWGIHHDEEADANT
jgi:hypothetical protein